MKKQLPLYILLAFLLIMNGFFLVTYFRDSKPPHHKGPEGPNTFLAKELNFEGEQLEQFKDLEHEHVRTMKAISEDIRDYKRALFDNITNNNANAELIDSISQAIGKLESQKDLEVYEHLRAIYAICDKDQQANFDEIVKKSLHRGPPPPPRPH